MPVTSNILAIKLLIDINTNILTANDTTVVLYFFLLLFRFLYAKIPPVPNILETQNGTFNFFEFNFISFEFLNKSIGLTLLAFFADDNADKYIVIILSTIANIIGYIDTLNIIPLTFPNIMSPAIKLTIFIKTITATIPDNIPKGIPINPNISVSEITFLFICFLVVPTLASIPYIFIFSVIAIANEFLMQNILVNIIINITTAIT